MWNRLYRNKENTGGQNTTGMGEKIMKCPYCEKEMCKGYIQCRDGVVWTPKKQPVAALAFLHKDSVYLANGADDNNRVVYAHHCAECRKVLIDYSAESME